jgi:hypothetical protein
MRRSRSIVTLLPILYLKGISTGDFSEALAALLAKDEGVTADLKFVENHRFEIPMQGRSFFVRIAAGAARPGQVAPARGVCPAQPWQPWPRCADRRAIWRHVLFEVGLCARYGRGFPCPRNSRVRGSLGVTGVGALCQRSLPRRIRHLFLALREPRTVRVVAVVRLLSDKASRAEERTI